MMTNPMRSSYTNNFMFFLPHCDFTELSIVLYPGHVHLYIVFWSLGYIYIYIYIERERERERESKIYTC